MKDPTILEIEEKKLVGANIITTLSEDKTGALWQSFMPQRNQIKNRTSNEYFSVQIYEGGLIPETFTNDTPFVKWAAIEISEVDDLPENLEFLKIPKGKYAVFIHHGLANEFNKSMQYIFENWLPSSGFQLDSRPHFEIMGDKYFGPTDANSEEEIWIPIK